MSRIGQFKVKVTGVHEPAHNDIIKQTVTVNMKTNSATSIIQDEVFVQETEKKILQENYDYFTSIKKMLKDGNMSIDDAAHMLILELKRVYISCINDDDEHIGVEEISYLDELVFNTLERVIKSAIEASMKKSEYTNKVYKTIMLNSVSSSVNILDYESVFNFARMNTWIENFIDVMEK